MLPSHGELSSEARRRGAFTSPSVAFGDTSPHVEGLALLGPVTDWGPAFAALS